MLQACSDSKPNQVCLISKASSEKKLYKIFEIGEVSKQLN